MSKYICPHCGNILETSCRFKCTTCDKDISSDNLYPPFNALNFITTSKELYTKCKNKDKEISNLLFCLLTNSVEELYDNKIKSQMYSLGEDCTFYTDETLKLSKNDVNNLIKCYEDVKSNHKDNEISQFDEINDKFEDILLKKYKFSYKTIDYIISTFEAFEKNRLRKPFVIMVASTIEMLFNDYFSLLLETKLGKKGSSILLNEYKYSSIKSCIEISNAFINTSLRDEMEKITPGFFDRWATLRDDRNAIVHSNNKYISRNRSNQIYKILIESSEVFCNLKSNVYKQN